MDIIEQVAEIKAKKAREEGRKEGEEKVRMTQEKSVRAFLDNTEFSVEKIAELVGMPIAFVEKIKQASKAG
jgi:hypothetical protein